MVQTDEKRRTCCFTGHRSIEGFKRQEVKKALRLKVAELILGGVTTFISGGALGFDTLAAQCVLEAKEDNPQISLVMILPCRDQCAKWNWSDKLAYEELLSAADDVYFLNERYITGCMHQRNRAMIEKSGYCIAYFDGKPGGTAYTVRLAREEGLAVCNIYYDI